MKKSIWTPNHEWLCALLRKTREEAGLTQENVAERLGKPQSFVSKYESGDRRLDLVELNEVCRAIGLPLSQLIDRFEKGLSK